MPRFRESIVFAVVLASGVIACTAPEDGTTHGSGGGTAVLAGGEGGGARAGAGGNGGSAGASGAGSGGDAGGNPVVPVFDGPTLLSETGLYSDIGARELAPGVRAYDVAYPLWTDGASKARYVFVPPGETIDTSDMDHWVFPVGTKAWKEFWRDGKHVETRILEKQSDTKESWRYVAYLWNADGADAAAVPEGAENALGTEHDVPDRETCWQCHSGSRDFAIGLAAMQLSGRDGPGALTEFADAGLLSAPPESEFSMPGTGVVQDALGYLHSNCGHCHSSEHFLADMRFFRFRVRVGDATPEETRTYTTAFGYATTHAIVDSVVVIEPGDPDASQAYVRMGRRDELVMPIFGTEIVDDDGLATIREWIAGLPPRSP